jgi:hypothetical protein
VVVLVARPEAAGRSLVKTEELLVMMYICAAARPRETVLIISSKKEPLRSPASFLSEVKDLAFGDTDHSGPLKQT